MAEPDADPGGCSPALPACPRASLAAYGRPRIRTARCGPHACLDTCGVLEIPTVGRLLLVSAHVVDSFGAEAVRAHGHPRAGGGR
ncbi:hypothetical protein SAV14893_077510 [Streptomyces avermitilis]|uniref:Uncharacterized protein n=1 Tax=Streptomyces avermitilis TaxID=33903 RepID=A0A4D4MHT6_STRAX|nr:hypothetical protein SAV14893_077510 [Streptomyces avermitilis]GDY71274.1 hypothetical protein SAV31267_007590 [Streptomyces avermitilis]